MLIALAARVDAAPSEDAVAMAIHYANLLTGVDDLETAADAADADNDDDDDDDDDDNDDDNDDDDDETDEAREGNATAQDVDGGNQPAPSAPDARPSWADATLGGAGHVALLDAEHVPAGTTTSEDANLAASPAGALETHEAWMRQRTPSRWGRLDLGVTWRRHWSAPMHTLPYRTDEVWLVATWRR